MLDNTIDIIPNILGQFNLQYCSVTDGELSHIILMLPYSPYISYPASTANIDAFYEASNRLYHATSDIKNALMSVGIEVVDVGHLHLKQLAECGGLGSVLHNQLLATKDYGTRITLQDITIKGAYTHNPHLEVRECSDSCHACDNACPTKALTKDGFERSKCLRHIQDNPIYHADMSKRVLGCEECQNACPHNACVIGQVMPEHIARILDLDTLLECIAKGKRSMSEFMSVFGYNYSKPSWTAKLIIYSLLSAEDYTHKDAVLLLANHQNADVAELARMYSTKCDINR